MLRQWIIRPLLNVEEIRSRQQLIQVLVDQPNLRNSLRQLLRSVHDLERLLGRVTFGNASARDLAALRDSLEQLPALNEELYRSGQDKIIRQALLKKDDLEQELIIPEHDLIDQVMEIRELLKAALVDEPPLTVREGGMFRDGYEQELDELRSIRRDGRGYIARLQEKERQRTSIPSLKVSYNRVFGYYIEVTLAHRDRVPEDYIRKQTLTNAERFITSELKEFEAKVLHAEDRIHELEYQLLQKVLEVVRAMLRG